MQYLIMFRVLWGLGMWARIRSWCIHHINQIVICVQFYSRLKLIGRNAVFARLRRIHEGFLVAAELAWGVRQRPQVPGECISVFIFPEILLCAPLHDLSFSPVERLLLANFARSPTVDGRSCAGRHRTYGHRPSRHDLSE